MRRMIFVWTVVRARVQEVKGNRLRETHTEKERKREREKERERKRARKIKADGANNDNHIISTINYQPPYSQ